MTERLRIHKYLSQAWICSRRKAEEYIKNRLIKINWQIAKIWETIDIEKDKVEMLEKAVKEQRDLVYYKLNKPKWVVTTSNLKIR